MAMFKARIAPLSADLALPNRLPGNGSFFILLLMAQLLPGRDLRANHAGLSPGGNVDRG